MTLQDILDQLNDFVVLFNLGNLDQSRQKRAINLAIDYYKRRLGLPCDEFVFDIVYYDGNYFYTLPDDFNEAISVEYTNKQRNTKDNEFSWMPDDDLLRRVGDKASFTRNIFSVVRRSGKQEAIIVAKDSVASSNLLEGFNDFITASKLASILSNSTGVSDLLGENDKTNKTEGDASFWLKLTASNASPVLIIPLKDIALQGIRANEEFFSLDIYLPDISKINNIQLLYAENATNYVIDAQNLNADYSPRKNGWNTLKFRKKDVLNFSYQNLTSVKIKITFQSMAVGQTYELNLDNFREQLPDYLQVVYYTNFKGKNSAGNFVSKLENESDVPLFEKIAPDLLLPIVLRAAFYLAPQLKTNTDFTTIFFQEAENTIINLGRSYPRKRIINYGKLEFSLE